MNIKHRIGTALRLALPAAVLLLVDPWPFLAAPAQANLTSSNPQAGFVAWLNQAHQCFEQADYPGARAQCDKILAQANAPALWRSLAQLRLAQSYEREGNLTAAKAAYEKLAAMPEVPAHHRWEARERLAELERRQAGQPPRDPAATRVRLPALPQPAVTFHVAPGGADRDPGTAKKPFATLERARDAIRSLKQQPLPSGGVAVLVHGGQYPVSRTFNLEAQDSGTESAPIVYRAAPGETPCFRGGLRLSGFGPVKDPALLARLPEEMRGKVVQADLRACGVTNLLPFNLGGFSSGRGFKTHPAHELFFDGQALPLARWPNEGFIRIVDVAVKDGTKGYDRQGSKVGKFFYKEDRPARWTNEPALWLYGYWFWDWADSYEKVEQIDPARRLITLAPPVHHYGFSVGAPFCAVNALAELDTPGEWYLDRATQVLVFYPPSDPAKVAVELSLCPQTLVRMDNVSHLRLEGLTWELGSADALHLTGGAHCLIAGCTVRRCAGNGIQIEGGAGHGILSCDIYSLGRGGTIVSGGDRRTLTPGKHFIENCHIYDLSRIDHTYTPAILLNGVGQRLAHNHLHHVRSSALRIEGNDHLIELNDIHDAVLESDDQGGADMFGNPTYRGNLYRYNYWHHIGNWRGTGEQPKCGQAGIRLDDAICGTLIYGNVFYKCSAGALGFGAVQIHGGKENILDNNLFVDCAAAVSFSPWPESRWRDFVKQVFERGGIDRELYLQRYPALARLGEQPNVNHLWRNVVFRCGEALRREPKRNELVDNFITAENPGLGDPDKGDFHLAPNALAFSRCAFAPIPVQEIGLYVDGFRQELSPTSAARQSIPFPDPRLAVCGLPWFNEDKPALRRLPLRLKEQFREPVWNLAQDPSGGRIRFRTDSMTLGLVAENPQFSNMHHMPSVGENGFDLYAGPDYLGSAWPDKNGKIAKEWRLGRERKMRDLTLYLPLYKPVKIQEITLDADARLEPAAPYATPKPVVYYGSSITQGGCASNPGGSCQAILERRLNADFVNLGFSGNGMGEPALAQAICELDPSCVVLDFWGNPSAEQYAAALPAFVDILRQKWPRLPILVVGPFYFPAEDAVESVAKSQESKRRTSRDFVEQRRQAGDRWITCVDGLKMLNKDQASGLVDGVHCNSLGFYFNAQGLEPFLKKALKTSHGG